MKWYKRVGVSIIRRKKQSFALLFIIFVISMLMIGSSLINEISNLIKNDMLQRMGASISIVGPVNDEIYSDGTEDYFASLQAYYEALEKLASDEDVRYYESSLILKTKTKVISNAGENIWEDLFPEYSNDLNIYFGGVHDEALVDVREEEIELIEGRTFTKEEMEDAAFLVVIPADYYMDKNGKRCDIQLGDKLPVLIGSEETEKIVYLEVIGKYQNIEKIHDFCHRGVCSLDLFYLPVKSLENIIAEYDKLLDENHKNELVVLADEAVFQLNNVSRMVDFKNNAVSLFANLNSSYTITAADDIYGKTAGSLMNIEGFMNRVLQITSVLGCFILALMMFVFFKDRLREIGIYAALGEKRILMVFQLICEVMLIGLLSLCLAAGSVQALSKRVTEYVYWNAGVDEIESQLFGSEKADPSIERYEIVLDYESLKTACVRIIAIMLLACAIPVLFTIRLKPKYILLNDE